MTKMVVRLCGFFAVEGSAGGSLRPPGKKPAALLAYLAYLRGKEVTRDRLIDLFWSDRGQKQGQDSLRQAIYVIRDILRHESPTSLISNRNHAALDPGKISYDLWRPDGSIDETVHETLLEDLDFISPVFDDWLTHARREIRNRQISRAERLLAGSDPTVSPERTLEIANTILRLDPTNEPAARTAISIHAKRDEIGHGHRIFQDLRKRLQDDELDVSEKTQNLFRSVTAAVPDAGSIGKTPAVPPQLEPDTDLPLVEVAAPSNPDKSVSAFVVVEEFFDRLISRMVQMPELRVRALESVDAFSSDAYRLHLLPSVRNEDIRIALRLSSGSGETFWTSGAPVALQDAEDHIDAKVDTSVTQITAALEENTYRCLNAPPKTAYEHYVVAQRLFHAPAGDDYMEKVLGHLQDAVQLDPDFLPAIERLVKFYNTGSFMSRPGTDHSKPRQKAYELAQRLLFLNSQYPTAHVRMTSCLLWQGKFQSAERAAHRAMELKPYDPYVLNVLGTALVYLGDLDAAEKYYNMAEERLLHDMDFVRTDYGELFYLKHDFDLALSWLETPEVRTPYRTLFWRAPTLAQLDRLPEAREDVEAMIEDLRKRWSGPEPFDPEAGIQWMCDMKPYRRTKDRDLLVDGFNKAGVKITAKNFP